MTDPRMKFILFIAFSLGCFVVGYYLRRYGVVKEERSRPLHLWTVIGFWGPISMLSFWGLKLDDQVVILMLSQPLLMLTGWLVVFPLARKCGVEKNNAVVVGLAAALSNHGFTLGAYLCYALLEPGDNALRLGITYVTSMQIFMILIFYPIAHHYGPEDSTSVKKLMVGSFLTIRAMPLYLAGTGVVLNLVGMDYPGDVVEDYKMMDVLFFLGAAGSYAGVGMRFRFGDMMGVKKLHGLAALAQFVLHPVATWGLIAVYGGIGLGLVPLSGNVMLLEAFTPTALNLVIISNLFHLDARLASTLWLVNTVLFCVLVLPILLIVI